jgi:hypothetical protein
MAKVMRELVKQMTSALKEGKEKGDAVKEGLENALKGGHLSIHEWNLGELFRECYGAEAFDTLKHESGASLRGAGIHEAAAEVEPQQWTRPSREREERDIYDKPKQRWTETLPEVKP